MQSLSKLTQYFANQRTKYNSPVIQQIVNEQKNTNYIPQSIANVAVQVVSMNNTINTNQLINSIAKSISNQAVNNVSVKNMESVIKQIALQTSKNVTPNLVINSLKEISAQINQSPTGPLAQAIIQLAKLNINNFGKDGQLVKVIKEIARNSNDDRNSGKNIVTKIVNIPKPLPESTISNKPESSPLQSPNIKITNGVSSTSTSTSSFPPNFTPYLEQEQVLTHYLLTWS
jgi:hypothetical protein